MNDQTEKELNRLTLVGWIVLAANMLTCCVLVPLVLINVCPGVLEAGGRIQRYAVMAGFFVVGGAGCFLSKWVLEKCGVTVLRPPEQASCPSSPAAMNEQTNSGRSQWHDRQP